MGKRDNGKVNMDMMRYLPKALESVCYVLDWAVKENGYDKAGWRGDPPERYLASAIRHYMKLGDDLLTIDEESRRLHLTHMACSVLIALDLLLTSLEDENEG